MKYNRFIATEEDTVIIPAKVQEMSTKEGTTIVAQHNPNHDELVKENLITENALNGRGYNPNRDPDGRFGTGSGPDDHKIPYDVFSSVSQEKLNNNIGDEKFTNDNIIKSLDRISDEQNTSDSDKVRVVANDIANKYGFDKKPKIISTKDFNKLSKDDYYIVYRGTNTDGINHNESFRTGDYYVGSGDYGVGTYTTSDAFHASSFAKDGKLLRVAIPKSSLLGSLNSEIGNGSFSSPEIDGLNVRSVENARNLLKRPSTKNQRLYSVLKDPGLYSMREGYDGVVSINGKNEHHIVFYNRSKMIVDENDYEVSL